MGEAAQEHPQEAAKEAQGQHRPTELQISSTENITSSCRIENITGGQLTPSPLSACFTKQMEGGKSRVNISSLCPSMLLVGISQLVRGCDTCCHVFNVLHQVTG